MKTGFTLIELLVVIAVLGILASVVLVAINPGERINEANDAGNKSDVGQVATALESYYTSKLGTYTGATSGAAGTLVSLGFLKRWPGTTSLTVSGAGTVAAVYDTLVSASAGTCVAPSVRYWCFTTATGVSAFLCKNGTPLTSCT